MNVTLDGFMAGPNCELDWHFRFWNHEMAEFACEQLRQADLILLGRITYNGMSRYWPSVSMDSSFPRADIAFAEMMNDYQKIVFSKTLEKTEWNNSRLVRNDIHKEVRQLKKQQGRDMIIYGSGKIVNELTKAGLIDDYILWMHPIALGKGKTLFKSPGNWPLLHLFKTKVFSTGVAILHYKTDITLGHSILQCSDIIDRNRDLIAHF
jgi:dihydrofolate reductase